MRDLPLNRILQGNALDCLRGLPENSVHCTVTSPPYWSMRDYQIEGQLGLEATPQEYLERMVEVFREVHRVLRPDGTLWLNMGDCYATGAGSFGECPGGGKQGARWRGDVDRLRDDKRGYRGERLANGRGDQPAVLRKKTVGRGAHTAEHAGKQAGRVKAMGPMNQPNRMPISGLKPKDLVGMPWRLAFALQADGWWLRSDICWSKLNPMPESVTDRPTKSHEYVFLLAKSERYYYDSEAIREPDHNTDHPRRCEEEIDRTQPGVSPHRGLRTVEGRNGLGRNKRTVWTIATSPFPEAHFATYPQELVEPCVLAGTSERGCCSNCGAPYVRRMERQAYGSWHNHENDLTEGNRQNRDSLRMRNGRELAEQYVAPRTVGWDKTCACDAKTTVPGIVLDPFMGSGTTALVALRAGRKFVGIELNDDYIKIANKRIEQEAAQARMF